jgi:hypothetical protein
MNTETTPGAGPVDQRVRRRSSRWFDAGKELPPTHEKTFDSEALLCMAVNECAPFVGWYNSKTKEWAVLHWKADSRPMRVLRWRHLPKTPDPVYT